MLNYSQSRVCLLGWRGKTARIQTPRGSERGRVKTTLSSMRHAAGVALRQAGGLCRGVRLQQRRRLLSGGPHPHRTRPLRHHRRRRSTRHCRLQLRGCCQQLAIQHPLLRCCQPAVDAGAGDAGSQGAPLRNLCRWAGKAGQGRTSVRSISSACASAAGIAFCCGSIVALPPAGHAQRPAETGERPAPTSSRPPTQHPPSTQPTHPP